MVNINQLFLTHIVYIIYIYIRTRGGLSSCGLRTWMVHVQNLNGNVQNLNGPICTYHIHNVCVYQCMVCMVVELCYHEYVKLHMHARPHHTYKDQRIQTSYVNVQHYGAVSDTSSEFHCPPWCWDMLKAKGARVIGLPLTPTLSCQPLVSHTSPTSPHIPHSPLPQSFSHLLFRMRSPHCSLTVGMDDIRPWDPSLW